MPFPYLIDNNDYRKLSNSHCLFNISYVHHPNSSLTVISNMDIEARFDIKAK